MRANGDENMSDYIWEEMRAIQVEIMTALKTEENPLKRQRYEGQLELMNRLAISAIQFNAEKHGVILCEK